MAECIDKQKLIDILEARADMTIPDYKPVLLNIAKFVQLLPAAEVEPVKHGRWIVQKCQCISTTFECSECGRTVDASNNYFAKPTAHIAKQYPYCHCGAKMDGGADNG